MNKIDFTFEEKERIIWIRKRASVKTAGFFVLMSTVPLCIAAFVLSNPFYMLGMVIIIPVYMYVFDPHNLRKIDSHLIVSCLAVIMFLLSITICLPLSISIIEIEYWIKLIFCSLVYSVFFAFGIIVEKRRFPLKLLSYQEKSLIDFKKQFVSVAFWLKKDVNDSDKIKKTSLRYFPLFLAVIGGISLFIQNYTEYSFNEAKGLVLFLFCVIAIALAFFALGKIFYYFLYFHKWEKRNGIILYTDYEYYLKEQEIINKNRIERGLIPVNISAFYFDEFLLKK